MDIYSRKIVAWEVHEVESGELARQLIERALIREGCWHNPPVLHSDNGAPMTSYTLRKRSLWTKGLKTTARGLIFTPNRWMDIGGDDYLYPFTLKIIQKVLGRVLD